MIKQLLTPEQSDIAATLLLRGGIVAFPTDTVYGLAAHPDFPAAVARLFEAKERPPEKSIPVLIADRAGLEGVTRDASPDALRLAEAFWPGALTIVIWRKRIGVGEQDTIAIRVPALELARRLIQSSGGALAVTSANISGGQNCTTAAEVLRQLGGRVDAIIDGGPCPGGVESTVVDASSSPVRILRQGAITRAQIEAVVSVRA